MDPTRGEFVLQPVQRQVRRLADPFQNVSSVPIERPFAVSAHLARRHRTGSAIALRPLHHRGHRNTEPECNRSAALAT
jgi:hypothetical protein